MLNFICMPVRIHRFFEFDIIIFTIAFLNRRDFKVFAHSALLKYALICS